MLKKVDVLGVGFNPLSYDEIKIFLEDDRNRKGYISFPDIYNILRANEDDFLRKIYQKSTLTLPDGKPSQYFLKKKGHKVTTISGYWLCKKLLNTNLSHYFYGSSTGNLRLMKKYFSEEYSNANILGYKSPPMLAEHEIIKSKELQLEIEEIKRLQPNIIWIGIGSPKQDLLMHYYNAKTEGTIMIGVGAVFDYFAGTAYMGPEWLKKAGLRWLYQLMRNPKRYYGRLSFVLRKLPLILVKRFVNKQN